jgi:hypothetical protein
MLDLARDTAKIRIPIRIAPMKMKPINAPDMTAFAVYIALDLEVA